MIWITEMYFCALYKLILMTIQRACVQHFRDVILKTKQTQKQDPDPIDPKLRKSWHFFLNKYLLIFITTLKTIVY